MKAHAPRALGVTGTKLLFMGLVLAAGVMLTPPVMAAGPAPVALGTTAHFTILAGAAITYPGSGTILGDIGAYPIAGSAISIPAAQVTGIVYARDATYALGASIIDSALLLAAQGDLTIAYNDAAGRTPVPTGPFLNPGAGNIGGLNLVPGLYKFTGTALITGLDVTLTGGPDDVWIFQIAADLQLGSGISVILAGGARAQNIFWQVGTSATLGTGSTFKGTIMADQAITMDVGSTMEGRALASIAGVAFSGASGNLPQLTVTVTTPHGTATPPAGTYTNDHGMVFSNAVTSSDVFGTTQYVSTGWIGTGSATNGVGTNTAFSVTTDSTVAWTWTTQYMVTVTAGVNGAVSPTAPVWVDAGGSTPSYLATPDGGYAVDQWYTNGIVAQAGGTSFSETGIAGPATILVTFVQDPQVSITWPTNGTVFTSPAAVTVLVSAVSINGGGITNVQFYAGTNLIGSLTNAPYSIVWYAPLASNYVLTATAYDASPNVATSLPVNITVLSTLWDGATDMPGNWRYLPWFGWFNDGWGRWGGWIWHAEFGWMYPVGSSTASIWFWNPRMNTWLWISETDPYPFLIYWSASWHSWLYYYRGSGNGYGGWFYNYATGQNVWL